MTLEEMILLYRVQADDKAEPYLADDELLTLYANEGQTEACRRAELLRDSASPMCVLTAAPGDEVIAVDARIVRILRAKVNGRDVGIVSGEHMDAMAPNWQDDGATGAPTHLIEGVSTGKLHLWPRPDAPCTVRLTVQRLPLKSLMSEADKPEIRPELHAALVDWMAHRVFSQQDGELYNPGKASLHLSRFESEFGTRSSGRNEAWIRNGLSVMAQPIA